ncbi:MAG: hypothetical protein AAF616_14445 [Bacteroidota bacterium]
MKNLIAAIGRGLIIGGGFGTAIGQFIGQFTEDQWFWITNMMIIGIVLSTFFTVGFSVWRSASKAQEQNQNEGVTGNAEDLIPVKQKV